MDCRLVFALFLALVFPAAAQVKDVKKNVSTNNLLESFDVGTGLTITFESGSTLTFNGTLADGVKLTFNPDGTNAGINVGSYAGVPSSLANGDLWYDSTANALKARINGSTVSLGAGGGGGSVATDTIFDAAGDTVYGTGADTASRLAIGTAGQAFKVNAGATAPEWGTLGYAGGGTNATTQADAVTNMQGAKIFASGAAITAATPTLAGQMAIGTDGSMAWGFNTSAGGYVAGGVSLLNPTIYIKTLSLDTALAQTAGTSQLKSLTVSTGDLTISNGRINADCGTGNSYFFKVSGSTFVDNVFYVGNTTDDGVSKGYSAMVFVHPADAGVMAAGDRVMTNGYGPNVASEYGNKGYIAMSNTSSPTSSPGDMGLYAEQDNGSGLVEHRRIYFDNTNKKVTIYGWSNTLAAGPTGVEVDSSANVTLAPTSAGTVTIGGGATASSLLLLEPSGSGTNYTAFKAQAQAGNVTYTLPAADGSSGQVLSTNGSGTLSWATGASGSVATDTIFDAKGDLPVGTGADTAAKLSVGTNGQVLTADSAEATGVKWATVAGTGTVTNTGGNLTLNAVVLGAGTADSKVSTGITTDGSTDLKLGVSATTEGRLTFFNATSGQVSLRPVIGEALGTNVIRVPAISGTMVTTGDTGTVTNTMLAGSISLTSKVTGTLPVANGGTGQTSYTDGQLLIGNTTGNTLAKATLTAGTGISVTNGGGSITIASTDAIVQTVTASTASTGSTSTAIPSDDTIPQNTEGAEALTVSITPTASGNKLRIQGVVHLARSTGTQLTAALFRDSTADAIAVFQMQSGSATNVATLPFYYEESAGSTSATTYKLRYGSPSGTTYLNQSSGGRTYGGTMKTMMSVSEVR